MNAVPNRRLNEVLIPVHKASLQNGRVGVFLRPGDRVLIVDDPSILNKTVEEVIEKFSDRIRVVTVEEKHGNLSVAVNPLQDCSVRHIDPEDQVFILVDSAVSTDWHYKAPPPPARPVEKPKVSPAVEQFMHVLGDNDESGLTCIKIEGKADSFEFTRKMETEGLSKEDLEKAIMDLFSGAGFSVGRVRKEEKERPNWVRISTTNKDVKAELAEAMRKGHLLLGAGFQINGSMDVQVTLEPGKCRIQVYCSTSF